MKMRRNVNAPPTADLVQYYIDSAYDNVKLVSDNLDAINALADALGAGTFDNLVYIPDIDTLAELNAIVQDEEIASEAYVNDAVTGLYDFKGGYDPVTNTPDLTTAPNGILVADSYQVTVAGTFFTANVEPGDQVTAVVDNPSLESHWSIVNRNIDSAAFATAAQGDTADSALQPGGVDNVSELINDVHYADDQTPAEIEAGYNAAVDLISQLEAEAGVSTTVRRWNALRVAQAAKAQTGAIVFVTSNYTAAPSQVIFCDTSVAAIQITMPAGATGNSIWIIDAGHNASINNITIVPDGADTVDGDPSVILDQNEGFCNAAFNASATDWRFAFSGVPDLIEQAPHTHIVADITDHSAGFTGINVQTGLTYTFVATDLVEGVTADNAADSTYSIPDGLGSPGDLINLYNLTGSGEVVIDMAGTDTLDTSNNNCAAGKAISAEKISATVWAVIGGSAAP